MDEVFALFDRAKAALAPLPDMLAGVNWGRDDHLRELVILRAQDFLESVMSVKEQLRSN